MNKKSNWLVYEIFFLQSNMRKSKARNTRKFRFN